MTNPALKDMVKIGYATDVESRRKQLSTTALPYEYEIYATYETSGKLEDKKLHKMIDNLNPDLRISKNREFFILSPEDAYELLESIATISGTKDKLKKVEGMAWDLFHLWDIPTEMAVQSHTYNAIILQAFATHDDALAQIAKLNPIIRIAFYEQEVQIKYKLSLSNFLHNDPIIDSIIDNQEQRECLCDTVNLIELSNQLEHEFLNTIK